MRYRLLPAGRTILAIALLCAATLHSQEFRFSPAHSTMSFELRSTFLVVVDGQIGDLEGLKFILDTGASYTVIDRKVADRLRLARRPGKITNFDREASVEWADLPQLRIGPLQADGVPVMVARLADYSDFTQGVDGIIGLDLLARSQRLMIDYERQSLSWDFADGLGGAGSMPTCLVVPLIVQGVRFRLALDTGLQGILLYKDQLRKGLPQLRPPGEEALRVSFGRVQTTEFQLTGVRLAGPEMAATVFLMDRPAAGDPPGVDGFLGIAALNAKRVEFNFASHTFRWQ